MSITPEDTKTIILLLERIAVALESTAKKSSYSSSSGDSDDKEQFKPAGKVVAAGPWSRTQMPFGKHKDKTLSEIPVGYLDWLVTQSQDGKISNKVLEKAVLNYHDCKANGKGAAVPEAQPPPAKPKPQQQPSANVGNTNIDEDDDVPF